MPEPIIKNQVKQLDTYLDLTDFEPEVIRDTIKVALDNNKALESRLAELEERVTTLENK